MKYFTFFFGSAKSSKSTMYFTHSSCQFELATRPALNSHIWLVATIFNSPDVALAYLSNFNYTIFSFSNKDSASVAFFFQFLRHTKLLLTSRPLHMLIPLLTTVLLLFSCKPTSQFSCKLKCHRPPKTFSNCLIQGQVTLITSCYFFKAHPM